MPHAFRLGERRALRPFSGVGETADTLWDQPQPHSSVAKRKLDRRRVLTWFVAWRKGTAYECARGLEMLPTTVLPRVTELFNDGCLAKTDAPRRKTGFGGTARELEITQAGERELRAGSSSPAA